MIRTLTSLKLEKEQQQAIEHTGSPLLVVAGPGSGKTRVITERIKSLLKTEINPEEILCLTFSEKAADELRNRLENDEKTKGIDISRMEISTYHSFCRNLLLDNTISTGLGMKGGILDRGMFLVWGVKNIDKFKFNDHIEIGNNATDLIEMMIDGISVFNDELITPDKLETYVKEKLQDASMGEEETEYVHRLDNLTKIYREYVKFKKEIDIMDYDDLIVEANKLLGNEAKKHVLERTQKKYKHILIDEFQDNNYAQFSIVKKLAKDGNVTAVGDADQNIYRFQGAYTQIFEDFRKTFPDHTEVLLAKNWRNPEHVINLSNQLLESDKFREKKRIIPVKSGGSKVNVIECNTEFAQVEFIKNKIVQLVRDSGYAYSDFAILSRRQNEGLQVSQTLAADGIPIKYIGKSEIRNSSNAKVLFSFLRIIAEPMKSMVSITRILQEYGISPQNISKINHEASKRARRQTDGDYAFDVLSDLNVEGLTQKTELAEIFSLIQEFKKIAKDSPPSRTIYQIIRNRTDMYKKIANDDSISNFIERGILNDIIKTAYDFEKLYPHTDMKEFLKFISAAENFDIETKHDSAGTDAVQVSTIHKSKGLEFKIVFIINVASGKIPLTYTKKPFYVPKKLAKGVMPPSDPKEEFTREERRLLYVGMTRTIDQLFLTYPTQYENRKKTNKASKFLQDLHPETNVSVNYERHDSSADSTTMDADAMEIIKNKQLHMISQHLQGGQYKSAIQKILDLGKIDHYQKTRTTDGFSHKDLLEQEPSAEIDQQLQGQEPEKLGFTEKNLSYSKLSTYEGCPKKFWYQYVLNVLPRNQAAAALTKGKLFHKVVEFSAKRQKDENMDELPALLGELESEWDSTKYLADSVQKEDNDRKSLAGALETYHKWTSSSPNTIMALELRFTVFIGGFRINGVIDRVEKTKGGEYVIIDYKTGGTNKKKKIDAQKSPQLNLYSMALKENPDYGKLPVRASFFYVERDEGDQIFDCNVDAAQIEKIKSEFEDHIKAIQEHRFEAKPDKFTCKWCEYSDICDDAAK